MQENSGAFPTDAEIAVLLELARQGDTQALGKLLDCFRSQLQAASRQSLGGRLAGRIDESDVVQLTSLAVIRDFTDFRGEDLEQFIAWLQVIHRRSVLEAVRQHAGTDNRS